MVIDADGLFLVAQRPFLVAGCRHLILTPNLAEFARLLAAAFPLNNKNNNNTAPNDLVGRSGSVGSSVGSSDVGRQNKQEQSISLASALAEAAARLPSVDLCGDLAVGSGESSSGDSSVETHERSIEPFRWANNRNDYFAADASAATEALALSTALGGVALLVKGATDVLCDDNHVLLLGSAQEKGSPRRCGGVGDLLSGTTAVLVNWALQHQRQQHEKQHDKQHQLDTKGGASSSESGSSSRTKSSSSNDVSETKKRKTCQEEERETSSLSSSSPSLSSPPQAASPSSLAETPLLWAAWGASVFVKRSSEAAFEAHRRSTTAPDVLARLGPTASALLDE